MPFASSKNFKEKINALHAFHQRLKIRPRPGECGKAATKVDEWMIGFVD
jgi:hypothetical protein